MQTIRLFKGDCDCLNSLGRGCGFWLSTLNWSISWSHWTFYELENVHLEKEVASEQNQSSWGITLFSE